MAKTALKNKDDITLAEMDEAGLPLLEKGCAVACGLTNCLLTGIGAMISSCCDKRGGFRCKTFTYGFLQLLLAITIIGWCWAISFGCAMIFVAYDEDIAYELE